MKLLAFEHIRELDFFYEVKDIHDKLVCTIAAMYSLSDKELEYQIEFSLKECECCQQHGTNACYALDFPSLCTNTFELEIWRDG